MQKFLLISKGIIITLISVLVLILGVVTILTSPTRNIPVELLIANGFQVEIDPSEYFDANRYIVTKDKEYAWIWEFTSKKAAKQAYQVLYNAYLVKFYSPDMYGIKNSYLLYYGLINELKAWNEYYTKIDWDILNQYNIPAEQMLYEGSMDIRFLYPPVELPSNYELFWQNPNCYLPQCKLIKNKVYYGTPNTLKLLTGE